MGKHKNTVYPGCSRHCPLSSVRCKYGQKYIEKLQRTQAAASGPETRTGDKKKRKWEKYVANGTTAWNLLLAGSLLKRALRKGRITEEQIHLALSDEERQQLRTLLEKITKTLE